MAFKDIRKVLYNGTVILDYKDSSHRYSAEVDGAKKKPKSVTTIKGETLEKNGLMTWPLSLAMRHLYGFYDFKNEKGEQMIGFSKGVGVLRDEDDTTFYVDRETLIKHCQDANKLWTVKQKAGSDIGTLVHDAVEQYISGTPFDITVDAYRSRILEKEGPFENAEIEADWEKRAPEEVALANIAMDSFKVWWKDLGAKVVLAEEILYSKEFNLAGTMDYLLEIPGKGLVLSDLKTTKASEKAGAPEGVYYDFFIQLGIYASMLVEMGEKKPDDLMIISATKEGGFTPFYASDLEIKEEDGSSHSLTVDECIEWGKHVIACYYFMDKTKKAIKLHAKNKPSVEF